SGAPGDGRGGPTTERPRGGTPRAQAAGPATMNVLMAASEGLGFAKTGGLADVAGSLPPAPARLGHQCALFLPLYRCARAAANAPRPTDHTFSVPVGPREYAARLWRSALPDSAVPVYLVEQPELFDRDDPAQGRGPYQFTTAEGQKRDY